MGGLTIGNPDFGKHTEADRAHGHRTTSAADLDRLLAHTSTTTGHLIDCPVDYSDNDRTLNKEIHELNAKL